MLTLKLFSITVLKSPIDDLLKANGSFELVGFSFIRKYLSVSNVRLLLKIHLLEILDLSQNIIPLFLEVQETHQLTLKLNQFYL